MPRLLRHLGHPALTLSLLVLFLADALYWHTSRRSHSSLIGAIVEPVVRATGPHAMNFPWAALFADDTGALAVHAHYPDSDAAFRPYHDPLPAGHTYLADLYLNPRPSTTGLLAPVFEHRSHILIVFPAPIQPAATPSPEQLAQARLLYADFLAIWLAYRGDPSSPIPALLANRDGTHTTLNPTALLHDLIALPVVLLTAASILTTPRWLLHRYRRRIPAHLCPTCRYDRTGLSTTAACPECGDLPTLPPPT